MRKKLIVSLTLIAAAFIAFDGISALETRAVPPPPKQLLYASAKNLERDGEWEDAKSFYRMAIHNGATGQYKQEAFLGLARCEESQRNFWAAFLAIESSYPTRDELLDLPVEQREAELVRRAEIEMRLADELAKIASEKIDAKNRDGKELTGFSAAAAVYYAIVYNNPQTPIALQALIKRGDCLRQAGDFAEGEKSYRLLINTFPDAAEIAEAKISLAGLLAEKTAGTGGLRGREEKETVEILQSTSTAVDLAPDIKEKLATAKLEIEENKAQQLLATVKNHYAKRHNSRDRRAAEFLLNDIVSRYPRTRAANEAATMLTTFNAPKSAKPQ